MKTQLWIRGVAALLMAATAGSLALAFAPPPPRQENVAQGDRSAFMRKKLDYSQGLIEGLALENYGQISENARKLKLLSQAAEWEVPYIPNVELYVPYTTEFQRLCDELGKKAQERNIDGATLAYVQLTMNCVNCHKYVRGVSK
jgi:hypothetical protein